MKIDSNRVGLSLGLTFAVLHLSWLILFLLGFGDLWFKWTQGLHFIKIEHELLRFDLITAIVGLIGAFVVGYAVGFIFSFIWKLLNK